VLVFLIVLVFGVPALLVGVGAIFDRRRKRDSSFPPTSAQPSVAERSLGISLEGIEIGAKERAMRRGPNYLD
jgi:hypothetical protein